MRFSSSRAKIFIYLLVNLTIGLAWSLERSSAAKPQPWPALQGTAALEYLKQHGLYDSLGAAWLPLAPATAQQAYLKASNTGANDDSGFAVAISGDTVVVGADWEDSGATGINGNQSDDAAPDSGAVYVFVRSGTTWSQQAYLKASNTETFDNFGYAVAIHGNTLVVGAIGEDSNATGVNGDQTNNNAFESGAAYIFVRSGTTWSQQAYLKASNTAFFDDFGAAVAISGDTVIVGADSEDNVATDSGAAYVFVRSGTTWSQQAYLKASNAGAEDFFGFAVAVSGDTVVVGADWEDSNATGVNGDQGNNSATDSGAAYVFVRGGTVWSQQAYLKASNTEAEDNFGYAVAVSGNTVVVGAVLEDSSATGVNGNQSNNAATDSGAAYVFTRSGTLWSQQAYLKASNTGTEDRFGESVAIASDTAVIGAFAEDSNATGVNGEQSNNAATDSGAAYVFTRNGAAWSQYAYLKASNTGAEDGFGFPVALSGETVVIGAQAEDSNATGVNGDQSNNSASNSGAAYVFVLPVGGGCPAVSNLNPASGNLGSSVTLTGTQFTGVTAVRFANNVAANFTVVNDMTITTTVPAGATSGPLTLSKTACPDTQTATFTVCAFALNPSSQNFAASGGAGNVGVTTSAGCNWTATSNAGFITITAGASGTGSGAVSFTVAANTGPQRSGTLTVAGQTFTVTQDSGCSFTLAPTNQNFAAAGGAGSVNLATATGCAWTATAQDAWLTITSGANGAGPGVVSFSVAANTGPARSGTLTLAGQTFTVTQASGCTFSSNPTSQNFAASGGAGTVNVTTAAGCAWTATSNAGFITITAGATGNGNGTVSFSVAANFGAARTGTMTIAGQTFTVTQNAARPVKADFDDDDKTDLSVWRGAAANWLIRRSSDNALQDVPWGTSNAPYNDAAVPGDYDGDSKSDVAVWRPGNGTWYIKRSSDNTTQAIPWGAGYAPYNDVPVPGDYDGDGKTDLAVWRGSDSFWYIRRSSDGQAQITSWGSSAPAFNDVPVQADYDGDGKTDIAVFRRANGTWYIRQSSNNQAQIVLWGLGTDAPVPGDYDGDGKTDIAVWRGADTNWYVRRSSDGQFQVTSWGTSAAPYHDVPVPGDYDGDGKTDIAVWRSASGTWLVIRSSNGSLLVQQHGQAGDTPVPAVGIR